MGEILQLRAAPRKAAVRFSRFKQRHIQIGEGVAQAAQHELEKGRVAVVKRDADGKASGAHPLQFVGRKLQRLGCKAGVRASVRVLAPGWNTGAIRAGMSRAPCASIQAAIAASRLSVPISTRVICELYSSRILSPPMATIDLSRGLDSSRRRK